MGLQSLLLDVLVDVLSYLEVRDILALQRTCKNIKAVTRLHVVWKNVLEKQIIPSGNPLSIPSHVSPSNLSAHDLQMAAIYATRLGQNWASRAPIVFSHTEFVVDTPASYVQIAFFLPCHGGKYLLTINGGNTVSIWHLEPALRRSKKLLSWQILGAIMDAVPNSDGCDRATIALSYIANPHKYVALYNLSFTEDESGHPTAYCEQIFQDELPGRLKILRGNLIGMYRRTRGYLRNYHNQIMIEFNIIPTSPFRTTCLAMEVLSDSIITVRPQSIDTFQLPDVARDSEPRPPHAEKNFHARHISTMLCPSNSEWHSGAIIPYCTPYPAERSSPPSRPISILVREKAGTLHLMKHHHIFYPPRVIGPSSLPSINSNNRSTNSFPTEAQLYTPQVHTGVRPHFFYDVVVSPTSGRGLWLENMTSPGMSRSSEQLMIFSAPYSNLVGWPLTDIGMSSAQSSTSTNAVNGGNDRNGGGGVKVAAQNMPDAVRNCSYCSFDDGSGRVVVATHDGHVRVLQFGST